MIRYVQGVHQLINFRTIIQIYKNLYLIFYENIFFARAQSSLSIFIPSCILASVKLINQSSCGGWHACHSRGGDCCIWNAADFCIGIYWAISGCHYNVTCRKKPFQNCLGRNTPSNTVTPTQKRLFPGLQQETLNTDSHTCSYRLPAHSYRQSFFFLKNNKPHN